MAKKKTVAFPIAQSASAGSKTATAEKSNAHLHRAVREVIESLAVAFVLAFLFRTFEAEAFVIPTGSMAPTLMGQHKDLLCPECGYQYQAGASSESEDMARQIGRSITEQEVVAVLCPLCRRPADVDPQTHEGRKHPSYSGDRIVVNKLSYEFAEPRRWDVIVFKYPGEAQTNYIKRLVGLPGETVRIWHGDLYVKPEGGDAFELQRRSPDKLRAMAQIVYDNDYVVDAMTESGWPLRWQAVSSPMAGESSAAGAIPAATAGAHWTSEDRGRSFAVKEKTPEMQWLRYQHVPPSITDWQAMRTRSSRIDPRPQLVTDFYAYDTSVQRNHPEMQPSMLGMHWVGDLMLECELDVRESTGTVALDLVKGGRHFRCDVDCQSGSATLRIDGLDTYQPQATTSLGRGTHHVIFANIDQQLHLWVDNAPVTFDGPTEYADLGNEIPVSTAEDPGDLAPAGVGAQGAVVGVNHLKLWRDIYYIADEHGGPLADYGVLSPMRRKRYDELLRFWSTPALWRPQGEPSPFEERGEALFPLAEDQFFMLGDNSPLSMDARLWHAEKYVQRDLLIGKALFILWPHSFNQIPGTRIPFPFFPNFARMGRIR